MATVLGTAQTVPPYQFLQKSDHIDLCFLNQKKEFSPSFFLNHGTIILLLFEQNSKKLHYIYFNIIRHYIIQKIICFRYWEILMQRSFLLKPSKGMHCFVLKLQNHCIQRNALCIIYAQNIAKFHVLLNHRKLECSALFF